MSLLDLLHGKPVYLSGPMSGYDDHNFPAFAAAREDLRSRGLSVICPAEAGKMEDWEWQDYLRRDLRLLLDCGSVVVLPGWQYSDGANLEVYVALQLGMNIVEYDEVLAT